MALHTAIILEYSRCFVIGLQVFLFPVNPGFAMPRVSSVTSSVTQCPAACCYNSSANFQHFQLHHRYIAFPAKTDKKSEAVIAFLSMLTISTRTSAMLPEVRRGQHGPCRPAPLCSSFCTVSDYINIIKLYIYIYIYICVFFVFKYIYIYTYIFICIWYIYIYI